MATLEDVLGQYNQSNFDIGSTAALIRQLGQQAGLSEAELAAAVPVFGDEHRGLYNSGYTEGSNYNVIAQQAVSDALKARGANPAPFLQATQGFVDQGSQQANQRWQATQEPDGGLFGDLGPLAQLAALIPGPQQPFLLAANAVNSLSQGNLIGAGLNAFGAYSGGWGGLSGGGSELTALNGGIDQGALGQILGTNIGTEAALPLQYMMAAGDAPSGLSITDVPVDSVGNVVGNAINVPVSTASSISELLQSPAGQQILRGAATGGVSSTLQGRDPLTGALTGGMGGAFGALTGGMGSILPDLTGSAGLNSALYSGALAGAMGGNPLMGALSSGINQGIGSLLPAANPITYTQDSTGQPTTSSTDLGGGLSVDGDGNVTGGTPTNTDGGNMAGFFDSILDAFGDGMVDVTGGTESAMANSPPVDLNALLNGQINQSLQDAGMTPPTYEQLTAPAGGSNGGDMTTQYGGTVNSDPMSSISGTGGTGGTGVSKGQSILNQIKANPGTAVFNSLPFMLALYQANSQKNDISPYITNLNNLASQFQGNQTGYLNSLTNPYDQSTGINRQKLLESLNQRGVAGSSFGDQAINNFDYTSGLGRADLLGKGIAQGAQTGAGFNTQAINAINARNLSSNALIGAGLNASGQLFNPVQNDQFDLKKLFGLGVAV